MKIKATSMVKFGLIMMGINMIGALGFWVAGDRPRTLMFMVGTILWIIGVLIWSRNVEDNT